MLIPDPVYFKEVSRLVALDSAIKSTPPGPKRSILIIELEASTFLLNLWEQVT